MSKSFRLKFTYFILPALCLLIIGLMLNALNYWCQFRFPLKSYVIACGPVYSAFIAIYISQINKFKADEKIQLEWRTKTRFFSILLEKSVARIESNVRMLDMTLTNLKEENFAPVVFKFQNIDIIERTFKECTDNVYEALVGREGVDEEAMSKTFTDVVEALVQIIQYSEEFENTYSSKTKILNEIRFQYFEYFSTLKNTIQHESNNNRHVLEMYEFFKKLSRKEVLNLDFPSIREYTTQPIEGIHSKMNPSGTRAEIKKLNDDLKNAIERYEKQHKNVKESIESDLITLGRLKLILDRNLDIINRGVTQSNT